MGFALSKPHIHKRRVVMKACGIVAEFNPLHNGHEYIMNEARRLTGCDALVIAMSGDFVQRGEPAIIDKWSRCRAALSSGADLVIEIPVVHCLGNAGQYAGAAVSLLESLGCMRHICCGSGSGDMSSLVKASAFIKDNKEEISERIADEFKSGNSYPVARENAIKELMTEEDDFDLSVLENANDILALEYMAAANEAELIIVNRAGADYSEDFDDSLEYQSAGGIRKLFYESEKDYALSKIKEFVPRASLKEIDNSLLTSADDWTDILRYSVINSSADEIENCPSGGEGLGHLLKQAVLKCGSMNEIIMHCKSKRYTYTRISRLCMQHILGIDRAMQSLMPMYIRVLGFNEKGRSLLSHIKREETAKLPIITNINKEVFLLDETAKLMLAMDIKASDIYNLVSGRDLTACSDKVMTPVILK